MTMRKDKATIGSGISKAKEKPIPIIKSNENIHFDENIYVLNFFLLLFGAIEMFVDFEDLHIENWALTAPIKPKLWKMFCSHLNHVHFHL